MKKISIVILTAALFALLAGCSKKEGEKKAADSRPTIRLVTDATGIDDKSFNAAAWRGIVEFYGESVENAKSRGTLYDVVTCQTQDQYLPTLKQLADEGYDLICATGFTFSDAITEIADEYPEQKFMIVDVDWVGRPNVKEFVFHEEEGSYLVGLAAAYQAQADGIANPKFGFIGGVPGSTITKFEMGYIQGLRAVFPNAEVVDYYANDWGKPELAKTQAKNWYNMGIYAIFSAAGGTGNGTIAQAKEMQFAGKNVWAIGVDSDQYADGVYAEGKSAVLTSMIKRVETSTLIALHEVADGKFSGGVVNLALKDDGVDYSKANKALNIKVVDAIEAAKKDIISGKVKIYPTYKEALAAGVVPEGLGAIDD
ncbi:MAG: BMP family ABC transporter substrate-binding protein [Treponema sp.]|nr:BMP family ABC transporter substrate-binding protein [Treponema sp.]